MGQWTTKLCFSIALLLNVECCKLLANQFASEGSLTAIIKFSTVVLSQGSSAITVLKGANTSIISIVYYNGIYQNNGTYIQKFRLVSQMNGNFSVEISNLQPEDGDVYTLTKNFSPESCFTFYVLGRPSKPILETPTVSVNSDATLTCSSISSTTPSNHNFSLIYKWSVNEEEINIAGDERYTSSISGNTLTLTKVNRNDAEKRFTCTAKENVNDGLYSTESDTKQINVTYGPENVSFDPNSTLYVEKEGTVIQDITCRAECNPPCSFQWTYQKNMSIISYTAILHLGSLTSTHAGTYKCAATRLGNPRQTKELVVDVIYGPRRLIVSPNTTNNTYVRQKEFSEFQPRNCTADCWVCSYDWKGPNGFKHYGSSLHIDQLERSFHGEFTCTASNIKLSPPDIQTSYMNLEVIYGPDEARLVPSETSYTLDEMRKLSDILCIADCFPNCTYEWTKQEGSVSVNKTNTLSLGTLNRTSTGNYTCTTTNREMQKSASNNVELKVRYAPLVTARFSSTNYTEGSDLNLFCDGNGFPSKYYYTGLTQTLGSVEIQNANNAVTGTLIYSSIHFTSLQLSDTGTYTCRLNNGINDPNGILDQTDSVNLTVRVVPKILRSELTFAGATYGSVTVQVPFYCYPAVQLVQFWRLNKTITSDGVKYNMSLINTTVNATFYGTGVKLAGYVANLAVNDLREEDIGTYTLDITNPQGNTSVAILINAESKPTTPKAFIYIPGLALPTFMWSKAFNGGHIQTFVIQTSVVDTDDWTNRTSVLENDQRYQINDSFYIANITELQPATYMARLVARNSIGISEPLYLNNTFTVVSEMIPSGKSTMIAAVAGGIASAVVVLVIIAAVLLISRSRAGKKDKSSSKLQQSKQGGPQKEEDSSDEDVMVDNKMYESAGAVMTKDEPVYNKPTKKVKVELKNTDVYAVVDKTKKKDAQKAKKEKQKKKTQFSEGDVYENACEKSTPGNTKYENAAFEDNLYENPEGSKPCKTPKKNVNADGLIYADLAFNDQPKGQKKLVIHGLDEMTTYVQVDFNKKADPLPDSDTEEQSENKKK